MIEENKEKEPEVPKNIIDFNQLKEEFKRDNFKSMSMMKHEFLYTCINPLNEDQVICLEKNIYPRDVQLYNLQHVEPTASGQAKILHKKKTMMLGNDEMDDIIEEEKDKRQTAGGPISQKLGQGIGLEKK